MSGANITKKNQVS